MRFNYSSLEPETRQFLLERTERIHNLARMTAAGIVQIGQYLTEVKERLGHGRFLEWIEKEFAWTDRHARRFISVYEHVKSDNLSDLQIDVSALYLIAAPSMPEPVRRAVVGRAENGEIVTHTGTRALVQHFQETGEIPDIQVSLPEMIARERERAEPSRPSREDRERLRELRQEREQATAHNAALMSVIEAIERIADTPVPIGEIARAIDRFDTPDQDWHGKTGEAYVRLKGLRSELKR